jgi:ribosomal protein S18 acetylase RimI-like enzyme
VRHSPGVTLSAPLRLGLLGDRDPSVVAHRAAPEAASRAAAALGVAVEPVWLATDELPADVDAARDRLAGFDALWALPATPYRHTAGALAAIAAARSADLPFFGSCGGFQHALLEIARDLAGANAAHAELDPDAPDPVIAPLACSLVEETGPVRLVPDSLLRRAYGVDRIVEGYHCRYGLNPAFEARLAAVGVTVTARDDAGDPRAFELAGPRFFTGTLFQPERRALAGEAPPPIVALLEAALAARADGVRFLRPLARRDLEAARQLIVEYGASLGVDLDFQGFEAELAHLPGDYAPPRGALSLVTVGGEPAGCVGMRPLDDRVAEMKRLYARPGFRGRRLGERLAGAAIAAARAAGYAAIRLDTLPGMDEARSLYRRLGFREIPAYRHNPVAGTTFLELDLDLR